MDLFPNAAAFNASATARGANGALFKANVGGFVDDAERGP
jgi:hypothetical protein